MKRNLNYLKPYIPWLIILLSFQSFTAILLWLADIKVFEALIFILLITTLALFSLVCFKLIKRDKAREQALMTFLYNPDRHNQRALQILCDTSKNRQIQALADVLNTRQQAIEKANARLAGYQNYVQLWAHEIKISLSLLGLIVDNHGDELSPQLNYKLSHVKQQIQGNIFQILFYYKLNSGDKDYLFKSINVKEVLTDVLMEAKPLLDEKNFDVQLTNLNNHVYTDLRAFEFILTQIISNGLNYCSNHPRLSISMDVMHHKKTLIIKDNGRGVKECDLPYIFEKGFTGDSGDTRKKSTGYGLYLVKMLADDLNIDIEVKSEWGSGFKIMLVFTENAISI